jgi:hypothetical protein
MLRPPLDRVFFSFARLNVEPLSARAESIPD